MTKYIALNYGNNNVTDSRIFRVFSSALFNSASVDTRKELDMCLNKIEKGGVNWDDINRRSSFIQKA